MHAYELYATGMRKASIARELGVTKATIGNWSRADQWEGRLSDIVNLANDAANHAVGEELAHGLARLKAQTSRRIAELESLCGPSNHPSTRIRAIQLWLKLAGMDRALPTPTDPGSTSRNLELVEDLMETAGV